jgi:hypothetical protein
VIHSAALIAALGNKRDHAQLFQFPKFQNSAIANFSSAETALEMELEL